MRTDDDGTLSASGHRTRGVVRRGARKAFAVLAAASGFGGPSGAKIRALRWWMISLVMLGALVNFLTRASLGVAAPTVLADLLSDEASAPGLPNFTGAFIGMACQDLSGTAHPADFDWFEYREREFVSDPRRR